MLAGDFDFLPIVMHAHDQPIILCNVASSHRERQSCPTGRYR